MILLVCRSASESAVLVGYLEKSKGAKSCRVLGPVLLPAVSSYYQELATKANEERLFPKAKKKKKDRKSPRERKCRRQKEHTDEMDEFRSHLGMSRSSSVLQRLSPLKYH